MAFVLNIESCPNCGSKSFHFDIDYDKQSEQKNEFSSFIFCKNCDYTYEFKFKFDEESDDMMYLSDFVKQYNNEARRRKFKPCPFCGSQDIEAKYTPTVFEKDHTKSGYYKIICNNCGISTSECYPYEKAVLKWNGRVSDKR